MYLIDDGATVKEHRERKVRRDCIIYIFLSDQEDHRYNFETQGNLNYFIFINTSFYL